MVKTFLFLLLTSVTQAPTGLAINDFSERKLDIKWDPPVGSNAFIISINSSRDGYVFPSKVLKTRGEVFAILVGFVGFNR